MSDEIRAGDVVNIRARVVAIGPTARGLNVIVKLLPREGDPPRDGLPQASVSMDMLEKIDAG